MNTWNWKPASEKPQDSGWYLVVTTVSNRAREAWYDFSMQKWKPRDFANTFIHQTISHWAELPPPPPKPDPFEEWWKGYSLNEYCGAKMTAKDAWQAALKSKEGER